MLEGENHIIKLTAILFFIIFWLISTNNYFLQQIKLADKQAALEKLQWESMTSNRKVETLQEDLDSMQGEISSFMLLFEGLTKNDDSAYSMDYDITPYNLVPLPHIVSLFPSFLHYIA